jgi:LTXXQ motif family protein
MKRGLMTRFGPVLLAAALALPLGLAAPVRAAETGKPAAAKPAESRAMARVDRRIADLHAKLHITAAEAAQWQQFAGVMRENAAAMDRIFAERAKNFASLNAVDNMKSYVHIAEQHAQNMQRLATSFETLYQAMSPQQQKTADEVFRGYAKRRQERHKRR